LKYNGFIFIELNHRYHFIRVDTILKISAAGFYTELMTTTGKKGLVQKPMKEWEEILPVENFERIHRSTIVNIEYVDRVERGFDNSYHVYLKGYAKPEAMSRRHIARMKDRLGG
jgi:DNA-binding LytR/AlgR family response regulator